jgi:hypothetical protein
MPIILATWETWDPDNLRFATQGQPAQILLKIYLQNNHSQTGWRCGSNGRPPALRVWGPEFKLWSTTLPHKKKKKKKIIIVEINIILK